MLRLPLLALVLTTPWLAAADSARASPQISLSSFVFDPRGVAAGSPAGTVVVTSVDGRSLDIQAGDYRTSFAAATSWTMRTVSFQGQVVNDARPGTFLQTVVNEKHGQTGPGKENDPFLGSGHRPETIDTLAIALYDGATHLRTISLCGPETPGKEEKDKDGRPLTRLAAPVREEGGTTVVLRKTSRLVSAFSGHLMSLESATVISTGGIEEYVHLTAGDGNLERIAFVHPCMFMLPLQTKSYLAFREGQPVLEGTFLTDNSMTLRKPITALMTWMPKAKLGLALYHTSAYANGEVLIWNRPHDHKLYFRYPFPRTAGQRMEYRLFFKAFRCQGLQAKEGSGAKPFTVPSGSATATAFLIE